MLNTDQNNFLILPNPASEKIIVFFNQLDYIYKLIIYNQLGAVCKEISINKDDKNIEIPLTELENGIFYICFTGGRKIFVQKLIVIK